MKAANRSVLLMAILLSLLLTTSAPIAALSPQAPPLPAATELAAADFTTYTLTILSPTGLRTSQAWAVNESGQVVGQAEFGSPGVGHAFYWDGTMQDIHSGTGSSIAWDINDAGVVVGNSFATSSTYQAWRWTEADGQQLLPSPGSSSYVAYGINNSGQIVGGTTVWDGDTVATVRHSGSAGSSLAAVSDTGLAAATLTIYSGDNTFLNAAFYDIGGGAWTDLGRFGYVAALAQDVNSDGLVVGNMDNRPAQGIHAFAWTEADGMVELPTLGQSFTGATGVNDLGQIVGYSKLPGNDRYRACIWQDGLVADLNDLIPAGSGWVLYQAFDINDRGQIVGHAYREGVTTPFYTHAFLLTPAAPAGDVVAPARVQDLGSAVHYSSGGREQITKPGEAYLLWTAPGDDGDEGTATTYDIRYHTAPITDATWSIALQVTGEPAPAAAGTKQSMIVGPLPTGTRWYFALKTADEVGNWSPASNVPSLQDSGFRPDPDGYRFANFNSSGEYDPYFTIEDLDRMAREYHNETVCSSRNPYCVPYRWAQRMLERWNKLRMAGNCNGFVITAARFFKSIGSPGDLQAGAAGTYGLTFDTPVARHIAYYMAAQLIPRVRQYHEVPYASSHTQVLAQLQQAMSGGVPYPPKLGMCSDMTYRMCHVVNPVAIETGPPDNDTTHRVRVYDSNHPGTLQKVVIDTGGDAWSYAALGWSGSGAQGRRTLNLTTLLHFEPPHAAGAAGLGAAALDDGLLVYLAGDGDLLISNSGGSRVGYVGGALVNEIAGAGVAAIAGGAAPVSPSFRVPVGDYSMSLAGEGVGDLLVVGPGYATWADDIALGPSSQEALQVSFAGLGLAAAAVGDGPGIGLTAGVGQQVTLGFAIDGPGASHDIEVEGLGVAAGRSGSLVLDPASGTAIISGGATGDDAYTLRLVYVDANGAVHRFAHYNLTLQPGRSHHVRYGSWTGAGQVSLGVDGDGDGTPEQNLALDNQLGAAYAPMIRR